ncbi:MAG: hydroxypyruvate isomerase [Flavobacteriaceae bacterium TMED121]|nr:MAG: hydroxypyruvate isomerase [Flavobacteriaceae bacterium TMED121]|tara:strand:- start:10 stop:906 length:897 start_codon:yes stop_codon:yes gene_type:complete
MNSNFKNKRRNVIKQISFSSIGLSLTSSIHINAKENKKQKNQFSMKGKINHSVCKWCFSQIPLEEFAVNIKAMGITGIDLIGPKQWHILKKYDLISSMCNGAEISLTEGWNDKQYHNTLVDNYIKHIDMVADAGFKNLICFSGNRRGINDETGLINCAEGLKRIIGHAEKKGVIIQMELLNSKVDHADYMCDNSNWGIELCRKIESDNFKLLFDIYHMQISEGDIIRTITDNHHYIGHYHTAGVPGRNEIDQTQELFYPAIMKAIVATGFNGFTAQEFIPVGSNPLQSLEKAIKLCDV